MQCISASQLYRHRYGEVLFEPVFPDTLTRIRVGSVLNISLLPIAVLVTAYAGVNLVNTALDAARSFGRL